MERKARGPCTLLLLTIGCLKAMSGVVFRFTSSQPVLIRNTMCLLNSGVWLADYEPRDSSLEKN